MNIGKRNNRRSDVATLDDLPKEDIFGFTQSPPEKSFPSSGRRLGTGLSIPSEFVKDILHELPSMDELVIILGLMLTAYLIARSLVRTFSRPHKPAQSTPALREQLSALLDRVDRLIASQQQQQPPQYIRCLLSDRPTVRILLGFLQQCLKLVVVHIPHL